MLEPEYAVTVQANPSPEGKAQGYKPVTFRCIIPPELAVLLMRTPVHSVSLGVESRPGIIEDKTKLLDFI